MHSILKSRDVFEAFENHRKVEINRGDGKWKPVKAKEVTMEDLMNPNFEFRQFTEMVKIGNVSFPKPENEGKYGEIYYYPKFTGGEFYSFATWNEHPMGEQLLKSGMLHLTKETAIAHAKALIKLSKGEV